MTEPGDMSGEMPELTAEQREQVELHQKALKKLLGLQKEIAGKAEQLARLGASPDLGSVVDARLDMFLDLVLGPVQGSPRRVAFELEWHKHMVSTYDQALMQLNEQRKLHLVKPDNAGGLFVPGRG